jgi:hypothetical protein
MSTTSGPDPRQDLPDWALGQAMNNVSDNDTEGRDERAQQLLQDFEDERHDQDDDPEQGGGLIPASSELPRDPSRSRIAFWSGSTLGD